MQEHIPEMYDGNSEIYLYAGPIPNQENIRAALALLLGPETDYHIRVRAVRRIARLGPSVLPLLLTTLSACPEITSPPWPWWPPQYEHCSRLLLHLSQQTHRRLELFLEHPALPQPAGPVLWTSILAAAGLVPHIDYELLLRKGLATPWTSTRYAAAMALTQVAKKHQLSEQTSIDLYKCQQREEPLCIRLAAAEALFQNSDHHGIEALIKMIDANAPDEERKAAIFVLATNILGQDISHTHLLASEREVLTHQLILALQDEDEEIAVPAAHALSNVISASALPTLLSLLSSHESHIQLAVLTALEEIANHNTMRRAIQKHLLVTHVVPLLRATLPELRRQASYALAAIGGEYATAVLGTTIINHDHPGHLDAVEGVRLLHGVFRAPARTNVIRWLLHALQQEQEELQITALDSLVYLAWQGRIHRQKKALDEMSHEIICHGIIPVLLTMRNAWVRQRTVELLGMLDSQIYSFRVLLMQLLHTDDDSGVRACVAYILGQTPARWAIPDLIQTLLDRDEYVVETAIHALDHLSTPDDSIVIYAIQELASFSTARKQSSKCLNQAAQALLKKWYKAVRVRDKFAEIL